MELTLIQKISIGILPILFAITLHEVAHGWVADRLGDRTARLAGRLTLNPIKHVDPIGTVILPLAMYALTGFVFGWAKPVPVDPRNLRAPRRDMAIVAAAGPLSNLLMAVGWALLMALGVHGMGQSTWYGEPLALMGQIGVFVNLLLMVFNLLPIPPLDGGRVLVSMVPPRIGAQIARVEPFGFLILLVLLFTGVLSMTLLPIMSQLMTGLYGLVGLR
ncbi:MAG: site-2 protease family protein [Halothiobacillaceae bacterium]